MLTVYSSEYSSFYRMLNKFSIIVTKSEYEGVVAEYATFWRKLNGVFVDNLVTFNTLVQTYSEVLQSLKRKLMLTDITNFESIGSVLKDLDESIEGLKALDEHPYRKLLDGCYGSDCVLGLYSGRFIAESHLENIETCVYSQLRKHHSCGSLILLGGIRRFLYAHSDFRSIFLSPVASKIMMIGFDEFSENQSIRLSNLTDVRGLVFSKSQPKHQEFKKADDFVFEKPINLSLSLKQYEGSDTLTDRECYTIILSGNKMINLAIDSKCYVVKYKRDCLSYKIEKIEKKEVIDLEIGDLILLTTSGAGDLLKQYEDKVLGDSSKEINSLQTYWKQRLISYIRVRNLQQVVNGFKEIGIETSNIVNIRNWISSSSIGLDDDNYFRLLLSVIGVDTLCANKIIINAKRLRSVHQQIGRELSSRLTNALKDRDISSVVIEDKVLEFSNDEGGPSKTVFVAECIDRTKVSIPVGYISQIRNIEETL